MADQIGESAKTPALESATPPARPQALAQTLRDTLSLSRSALPYFAAALLAAMVMGWYFYVFVPQKLEYFVGLRFRTLAVVSGQIKGKAEALGQSLSSVPEAHARAAKVKPQSVEEDTKDYLRLLVPDIQLDNNGTADGPGLHLAVNGARPRGLVAWDDVASQATTTSTSEFDDLVVADGLGKVLWQREKTTPRLGDLRELLFQPEDKGTGPLPSWALRPAVPVLDIAKHLPDTMSLKSVRIGAVSTTMLVQSITIDSAHIVKLPGNKLFVAAFVSKSQLEREAMRVPLGWLAVVWLPLALMFLALPFVKLATMNAKERFSALNLGLMAVATIAAAGLGAVIPFGPVSKSTTSDQVLERLANEIDRRIGDEASQVLELAKLITHVRTKETLAACEVRYRFWNTHKLCDLWGALDWHPPQKSLWPELDVVIWLDEEGSQTHKWTTKVQLTGRTSHAQFEHFRSVASGALWTLSPSNSAPGTSKRDTTTRFTIEPLRAPTTAERAVVYAMPLSTLERPSPDESRFLALNVRPHALVDAVMPPGYGFAVLSENGRVLFHSTDGLSLEENFFREVSDAPGVRERVRGNTPDTWSGDYHGIPHRIHTRPVEQIRGSGWRIVTFEDLTPTLASIVAHQADTFRISLLNLAVLLIAAGAGLAYTRHRGRDVRDLLAARQPQPSRLRLLGILLAVGVSMLIYVNQPGAHQRVDAVYGAFVMIPLATLAVCVYARCPNGSSNSFQTSAWARCELGLVVLLLGAVPAAGVAQVVHRVHDTRSTERWLTQAHQRMALHATDARRRATSVAYPEIRRTALQQAKAFEGTSSAADSFFYLATAPAYTEETPETTEVDPATGQTLVRWLLDISLLSEPPRLEDTSLKAFWGSSVLRRDDASSPALSATVWPSDGERRLLRWALMAMIVLGAIAAAYWARHRLTPPRATGVPTLQRVLGLLGSEGSHGVMLIGPPRTHKDSLVTKIVQSRISRFRLLGATVDEQFRKTALATLAARAGDKAYHDSKGRLWIHVSNLESQLTSESQRSAVLDFLEALLTRGEGEPARIVIVTTNIDPIAQFKEIFTDERQRIYRDGIPEVEFSRSSLLLSRFHRCFLPIPKQDLWDPWWNYKPTQWQTTLAWEAAEYSPLVEVAETVTAVLQDAGGLRPSVERDELLQLFQRNAQATYDLLWASCTRLEKIVLIQLAQEGFVSTINRAIVWGLIDKGLLVERPMPAIFNESFRAYLRHIEHDKVIAKWEREDGDGLWVVVGRLVASCLIAGGLFYLTTQDFSVDSLLPVVSGTGLFSAPAIRALVTRIASRASPPVTA